MEKGRIAWEWSEKTCPAKDWEKLILLSIKILKCGFVTSP